MSEVDKDNMGKLDMLSRGYVYAGFWWRSLSALIDLVLFFLLLGVVILIVKAILPINTSATAQLYLDITLFTALSFLYYPVLEASKLKGTIGKRLLGIEVLDADAQKIGILRSVIRHLIRIPSGFIYMIGFVFCAITEKKQSIHDYFTKTFVYRKRKPLSISGNYPKFLAWIVGRVNAFSTLFIALAVRIGSLIIGTCLILMIAVESKTREMQVFRSKVAVASAQVTTHVNEYYKKNGSYPKLLPEYVRTLPLSNVIVEYSAEAATVTLIFKNPTGKDYGKIVHTPTKYGDVLKWDCKVTQNLKGLAPAACSVIVG